MESLQTRAAKSKHNSFDDELGDDFLSSWKPSKFMVEQGLDLDDDDLPPKTKKKSFSLAKLDIDLDGDLNDLSSFNVDMSALDFPSSPIKTQKSKVTIPDSPVLSPTGKWKRAEGSTKFQFDFKGFDDLDLDDTLLKTKKEAEKPAKATEKGKTITHPASSESLSADAGRLLRRFAKDLCESGVSGENLGASAKTPASKHNKSQYFKVKDKEEGSPSISELKHVAENTSSPHPIGLSKVDTCSLQEKVHAFNCEETRVISTGYLPAEENCEDDSISESHDLGVMKGLHPPAAKSDKMEELQISNLNGPLAVPTASQSSEVNSSKEKNMMEESVVQMQLHEEQDPADVNTLPADDLHSGNNYKDEDVTSDQEMRRPILVAENNECVIADQKQMEVKHSTEIFGKTSKNSLRPLPANHTTEVPRKHSMQVSSLKENYKARYQSTSRMDKSEILLEGNEKEEVDKQNDPLVTSGPSNDMKLHRNCSSPSRNASNKLAGESTKVVECSDITSKKSILQDLNSKILSKKDGYNLQKAFQLIKWSNDTAKRKTLSSVLEQNDKEKNVWTKVASATTRSQTLNLLKAEGPNFSSPKTGSTPKNIPSVRIQPHTMQKSHLQASRPLLEKHEYSTQLKVGNSLSKLSSPHLSVGNALGAKGKNYQGIKLHTLASSTASQKRKSLQVTEKAYETTAIKRVSGVSVLSRHKLIDLGRETGDSIYSFHVECDKETPQTQYATCPQVLQHEKSHTKNVPDRCDVSPACGIEIEHDLLENNRSPIEENRDLESNRSVQAAGRPSITFPVSQNCCGMSNKAYALDYDGIAEKSECYTRDLEEMHKMFKRKHEEALDLHVRALVLNNSLLMLKNPVDEDRVQRITSYIEESFLETDQRRAMLVE